MSRGESADQLHRNNSRTDTCRWIPLHSNTKIFSRQLHMTFPIIYMHISFTSKYFITTIRPFIIVVGTCPLYTVAEWLFYVLKTYKIYKSDTIIGVMEYMLQYMFTQLFFTCFGHFNRHDYLWLFTFEKNKQNSIFPPMTSVFRQELIMEAPVCPNFRKACQPCGLKNLRGTGNGRKKNRLW